MSIRTTKGAHRRPRSRHVSRSTFVLASAATFALAPMVAPARALATGAPALAGTGVVTLIHAVPGLTADVLVDGKTVLTGFTAARVTDPVTLSAGKHTVTLKADNNGTPGKTLLTVPLEIVAGTTSTAVVGLTPDGTPKAYLFPESPVPVPNGQAGVIMRDVAAAGPVKLVVDGTALATGPLSDGESTTSDSTPGTHHVLVQSDSGSTVLGTQPAALQAGRVTTLYLIGSEKDNSLAWVATTRLASAVVPLSGIPTGDGSTAQTPMTSHPQVPYAPAAEIAAAVGAGVFILSRRRARARAGT